MKQNIFFQSQRTRKCEKIPYPPTQVITSWQKAIPLNHFCIYFQKTHVTDDLISLFMHCNSLHLWQSDRIENKCQIAQLVQHLTRDSGGLGLNPGLVCHPDTFDPGHGTNCIRMGEIMMDQTGIWTFAPWISSHVF